MSHSCQAPNDTELGACRIRAWHGNDDGVTVQRDDVSLVCAVRWSRRVSRVFRDDFGGRSMPQWIHDTTTPLPD
jgi:hypothetical protein